MLNVLLEKEMTKPYDEGSNGTGKEGLRVAMKDLLVP